MEESDVIQPVDNELLRTTIVKQFSECTDSSKITLKEFRTLLESTLNTKLDKEQKKLMKEQLKTLINSEDSSSSDNEDGQGDNDGQNNDGDGDDDDEDDDGRSDDISDSDEDSAFSINATNSPTTRSKTKPKKPRQPSHLKIHLEMRRKKQLAEAKIRAEELQAAKEQKFNEEDQKRAQLIAQKFNTNTDEARIQRIEDRVGLLGRLKEKRLGVLALNNEHKVDNEVDAKSNMAPKEEVKSQLTIPTLQKKTDTVSIDNDSGTSDESSDEDEDSDDELEIVGATPSLPKVEVESASKPSQRKKSPKAVLDFFKMNDGSSRNQRQNLVAASFSNPRAVLRNALRAKQYESGNKWLARELGYDKPEDHIRECKLIESKKQKQIIAKEEHRLRQVNERNKRLMAIVKGEAEPEDEPIGDDKDEEDNQVRTIVNNDEESEKEEEDEDEELAMARAIESEQVASAISDDGDTTSDVLPNSTNDDIRSSSNNNNNTAAATTTTTTTTTTVLNPIYIPTASGNDTWELTWPIWHMLPHQERKEIAKQNGFKTIGEFEESVILSRALNDNTDQNQNNDSQLNNGNNGGVVQPYSSDQLYGEKSELDDDYENEKESVMNQKDSEGESNNDTKIDSVSSTAEAVGSEMEEISDAETVKKDVACTMSDDEDFGLDDDFEDEKESVMNQKNNEGESNNDTKSEKVSVTTEAVGAENEEMSDKEISDTDNTEKEKRPKNAAWKAMLEREKQLLKKQKSLRKGQIDDEAEEEEEEEGVAGLEDFGFTVKSTNKEDEEDDNEADDEDLENVVDDISDGEGDEEAGDKARKELQAREEKMRHKEVLRRIREGYDGKRGGVAGGSSKRGNLRFDQLVAADNKDDAKRLGLLNDDELDSEDEEANVAGEVEDEEVLIDKMLKDRYLNRPELPEENFSDSDEESDDENEGNGKPNEDDEEDREQERLAKRFTKRARMNRLLELHGDDREFSQTRLLDEDEDLRKELTRIRTVRGKTVRQASSSSSSSSFGRSSSTNSNQSQSIYSEKENSLPMGSNSLSMAINRSRNSRKRKTSFLGSGKETKAGRRSRSSKAVSLGHVVFSGDNSSNNNNPSSSLNSSTSSSSIPMSRSSSFPLSSKQNLSGLAPPSKKRSISETGRKGSSLWTKVSVTGFHKRRRG